MTRVMISVNCLETVFRIKRYIHSDYHYYNCYNFYLRNWPWLFRLGKLKWKSFNYFMSVVSSQKPSHTNHKRTKVRKRFKKEDKRYDLTDIS